MKKQVLTVMLGAMLVGLVGTTVRAEETPKIVSFAQQRIGQRIGRGECTDLVTEAFRVLGYKPMEHVTREGKGDTYDWGTRVWRRYWRNYRWYYYRYRSGLPRAGHVIQFEECVFKSANSTWNMPHHTAIVEKADGLKVTLL